MNISKPFVFALVSVVVVGVNAASNISKRNASKETYAVRANAPELEISNIWGDVRVRPGKSGEIVVSLKEVRSAPNQRMFERSLQTIMLNVEANSDGLSMRVGDPENRWNKMNACHECRVEYQFDILVPSDAVIDVSTVNEGKIDVAGINGLVSASNVNGPVKVNDIHNCHLIESVNGPLDVMFSKPPTSDCNFETVNGDVTLSVPENTSLDVSVDLFNGDISSGFPIEPFALPAEVKRVNKDGSSKYLIKKNAGFRIGSGGPVYSIKSMNGDVRVQKNR